jgi:outer membrane protein TolC
MFDRQLPTVIAIVALVPAWPAAGQADSAPPMTASSSVGEPAALERVTFDEAVKRATERNPSIGQAAQAILRAQALLDQSKSVFRPLIYGSAGTVILDAARGFDGNVTQPRTQSAFNATLSYPVLAPGRWAAKNQAADQVGIARISAQETRRQVSLTVAQSYLAVIAARRQREIAIRNLDTARALEEYARARLEAGKGSRLNHVRSTQERAAAEGQLQLAELLVRRGQEALGVSIFADGPVDVEGDPELQPVAATRRAYFHGPDAGRRPGGARLLEGLAANRNRFLHTPVRHARRVLRTGQDLARGLPAPDPDLRRDPGARQAGQPRRP